MMAAAFQHWDDVDTPEALAFAMFACLFDMSLELDRSAVSVAVPLFCVVGFRGNNRIIDPRHLALVICSTLWRIMLMSSTSKTLLPQQVV